MCVLLVVYLRLLKFKIKVKTRGNTVVKCSIHSNRGSVYLIALITVSAIVSMVLIGVSLRSTSNTQISIVTQMTSSQSGVMSAAEHALQNILANPEWPATAESGVAFDPVVLDNLTLSGSVLDADTDLLPTTNTINYRIRVQSELGVTRSAASFNLDSSKIDYLAHLKTISTTHYWPMNEPEKSTEAIDQIGSATGEYQSIASAGTGMNSEGGNVPVFTDTNDHLEVPFSTDFAQCDGSISMWMRLDDTNKVNTNALVGMRYEFDGVPTMNVSVFDEKLYAFVIQDGVYAQKNCVKTKKLIDPSVWYHLVVTWGTHGLTVYLDGVEVAKDTKVTDCVVSASIADSGEQPLLIGGGYTMMPFSQPRVGFKGAIAHVSLHEIQLSDVETAELASMRPDLQSFNFVEDSWAREYFD